MHVWQLEILTANCYEALDIVKKKPYKSCYRNDWEQPFTTWEKQSWANTFEILLYLLQIM